MASSPSAPIDRTSWFERLVAVHPGVKVPDNSAPLISPAVFSSVSYSMLFIALAYACVLLLLRIDTTVAKVLFRSGIVHYVFIPLLAMPFLFVGLVTKKLRQRVDTVSALQDPRQPILLLRSFAFDNPSVRRKTSESSAITEHLTGVRLEEPLRERLSLLGPLVAIGNPVDTETKIGAIRLLSSTEHWPDVVRTLVRQSQLILLQLSPHLIPGEMIGRYKLPDQYVYEFSKGFLAELQIILEEELLHKTLLLSINHDGKILEQNRFQSMIEQMPMEYHAAYSFGDWKYRLVTPASELQGVKAGLDVDRVRHDIEHIADSISAFVYSKIKKSDIVRGHVQPI